MPRSHKPRRRYIPKRVEHDVIGLACLQVARLTDAQHNELMAPLDRAFQAFRAGRGNVDQWRELADGMNVGEKLTQAQIASDHGGTFEAAQAALAAVFHREAAGGTWTLKAPEITALDDAVFVHRIQLQHCSQGELADAIAAVKRCTEQALAGNASPRARVCVGALVQWSAPHQPAQSEQVGFCQVLPVQTQPKATITTTAQSDAGGDVAELLKRCRVGFASERATGQPTLESWREDTLRLLDAALAGLAAVPGGDVAALVDAYDRALSGACIEGEMTGAEGPAHTTWRAKRSELVAALAGNGAQTVPDIESRRQRAPINAVTLLSAVEVPPAALGETRRVAKTVRNSTGNGAGRAALTDERIDHIAELTIKGMPDGLQGFLKLWGWQQFAHALLDACGIGAAAQAAEQGDAS